MRNSSWRCTFSVIVTTIVAMISTGCKSGGWGMASPSWMSLGKKKPPTSSIAGTREPLQPPSISVPPYPASEPAREAAMASATPRHPSSDASWAAAGSSMDRSGSPELTGYGHVPGQTANAGGYATGPYSTGGAAAPTQQGFYSPTHTPGPAALTADVRGVYQPGMEYAPSAATSYGSPGGFAAPSTYGQSPSFPAGSGHGMMGNGFGAATPYGAQQYPGTGSSFGSFPTTPGTSRETVSRTIIAGISPPIRT